MLDAFPPQVPIVSAQSSFDILLVEDHHDSAHFLSLLLKRRGHRVRVAPDIKSALTADLEQRFDLLISDLSLPDGTGHDLIHQLLVRHPVRGIALSGHGSKEDIQHSLEAGFSAHLVKPVVLTELDAIIAQVARADETLV